MSMSLFWLIAMVLFGVLEAVTVGLTSIWFAVGALAALIAASLGAFALVQVIVFLVVSFVTLLLVRPLAIGREAVVTQAIDNLKGEGQVNVSGAVWTARSQEEAPIPAGARVRVLRIEGVKVIVSPVPEGAAVSGGEDGRL